MTATRIGKGITYIAILNAFQFVIGIIFYYVVSKILTPTEIGIMSTLNFVHATFVVLAPLGLQFAAVKYVAEHLAQGENEKASAVARTMIKMVIAASMGFLILFVAFAVSFVQKWVEIDKVETLYVVISVAATFGALRNAYLALLQGLQLFDKYAVANLASMGLSKLLGIVFVLLGHRLLGVVTGTLLGEIGGLSLTFFYYRGNLPPTREGVKQRPLLNFSLPIFGMMLLATFQDWSDRMLFLIVSRDLDALGLFELVIRASASLGIIGAIVDVIMFPTFSDAFAKGGKRNIGSMMGVALRYLGFMYFPAAVGMATISKTAMTILYQARTAEAGYLPLTIISIFTIFGTFATILNSGLKAIGKTSAFIRISLLALAVDGAIVYFLPPLIGLYGAVVARCASFFVTFTYTFLLFRRECELRIDYEGLLKGIIASISIVPPVALLDKYVHFTNIFFSLGAEITVAVFTYLLALLLIRALNEHDFNILKQIIPVRLHTILNILERVYLR